MIRGSNLPFKTSDSKETNFQYDQRDMIIRIIATLWKKKR